MLDAWFFGPKTASLREMLPATPFDLNDKLRRIFGALGRHQPSASLVLSVSALALSLGTFYQTFLHIKHDLVIVSGIEHPIDPTTYTGGYAFAVINAGNRDAMLLDLTYAYWDFKKHEWSTYLAGVGGFKEPFLLKPQEIRLVFLNRARLPHPSLDVYAKYVNYWDEQWEAELGIRATAMDSDGTTYYCSFPIGHGARHPKPPAELKDTDWEILSVAPSAKVHVFQTPVYLPYFRDFFVQRYRNMQQK